MKEFNEDEYMDKLLLMSERELSNERQALKNWLFMFNYSVNEDEIIKAFS